MAVPGKVLAVIPARGGSKGIPRKNLRPVAGRPLIVHTIEAALGCPTLTDVVVSTDSEEIRRVAIAHRAQAPFLRPLELSGDTALAVPTIQHAVGEMERLKGVTYDYVVMLQPTAPLRASEDITQSLSLLIESHADGVISIVPVGNWHPMKMKKIVNGLLVDFEKPPVENPPRQSLPPVYIVNGAIYATRREVLMNNGSFRGERCIPYHMPPERSVNIDNEGDLILAEYYINQRPS